MAPTPQRWANGIAHASSAASQARSADHDHRRHMKHWTSSLAKSLGNRITVQHKAKTRRLPSERQFGILYSTLSQYNSKAQPVHTFVQVAQAVKIVNETTYLERKPRAQQRPLLSLTFSKNVTVWLMSGSSRIFFRFRMYAMWLRDMQWQASADLLFMPK